MRGSPLERGITELPTSFIVKPGWRHPKSDDVLLEFFNLCSHTLPSQLFAAGFFIPAGRARCQCVFGWCFHAWR